MPGNGNWALQRQGRYAHAEHYVYEVVCAAGFRVLRWIVRSSGRKPGPMSRVCCWPSSAFAMTVDAGSLQIGPDLSSTDRSGPTQPGVALPGIELLAEGRFQDALAPLRQAVSLGDTNPGTLLNLAIAEDRAGDRARARRLMRQVAVSMPDWEEPMLRLAESLRTTSEHAAAEEAYRHVLELNPDRAEALIALSGLLLMREQPEPACDLLRHCCDVAPDQRRGLEHTRPWVTRDG